MSSLLRIYVTVALITSSHGGAVTVLPPFLNDLGFPGVRIMETHENYIRQHQDIRTEGGIEYGDVVEWVDFEYTAKMTALNAAAMASMAWAPPAPVNPPCSICSHGLKIQQGEKFDSIAVR